MGQPRLSREQCEKWLRVVQECLDDGFALTGQPSAIQEAGRRAGIDHATIHNAIRKAKAYYGLELKAGPGPDQVYLQRVRDEVSRLRSEMARLRRELVEARDLRAKVLNLTQEPVNPIAIPALKPQRAKNLSEAVILHLSDVHWGEVISSDELGGLNKYDTTIAGWRLLRCFQTAADLSTKHWSGPPVARFFLIFGGDMFGGDIHLELAKTNEEPMPRPVKELLVYVVRAIQILLDQLPCEIVVISVPGNHGRITLKPQAKQYVATNFDALLADLVEWHFKSVIKEKRVSFFRPESGDALFDVFGHKFLATHGDRIGSKGGQGFIGPAATIARGMKKIVDEYAASRVFIEQMFVGHFHTALRLEHGFSNGCLCGPNEYSAKMLRARPKPATQNFFQVHPERGITVYREIQVGHPDEGSLYQGVPK